MFELNSKKYFQLLFFQLETDYNNLYNGNDGLVQKYSKAAPILWDIVSSHVNPVFKGSFTDCSDSEYCKNTIFTILRNSYT